MTATSSALRASVDGGKFGLTERVAMGAAILGCVAALALGGLRASGVTGASLRAIVQPQPVMLAVDVDGCVYASAEGIPGEGCGQVQYTMFRVVAPTVDALNCVYASDEGIPGEGCTP